MDHIVIQGIEVFAHHGVREEERARGQRFVVDVALDLDLRPAAASDDLDHTVDYSELTRRVAETVRGGPWDLLETVADRVARACLEDDRVVVAEVAVHKPEVSLAVPVEDVRVSLRRRRTASGEVRETPGPAGVPGPR